MTAAKQYATERYDVRPLLALVGALEADTAADVFGVELKTFQSWQRGRRKGFTWSEADRYACAAGLHPAVVWPEWFAA